MGKQRKEIDLSAFDDAVAPKKEIDLSGFDNAIKKKNSSQPSINTGTGSSTGFNYSNPFNSTSQEEFLRQPVVSQGAEKAKRETASNKQKGDAVIQSLKNTKPINQFAGKSEREILGMTMAQANEGARELNQQQQIGEDNIRAQNENIGLAESVGNSANNAWIQLQKNIPQLQILSADVFEKTLGKDLAKSAYANDPINPRDIDEVRMEAYNRLDELNSQIKQVKGNFADNIRSGDVVGVAANSADAIFNLMATALPALATRGALTATSMTGQTIADYNQAKAKSQGISVKDLYEKGDADLAVPLAIGSLATGLEYIGLKGVEKAMLGKLTGTMAQKAGLIAFETNKEGLTEFIQTGLDGANKALSEGKDATDGFVDAAFSKDGINAYLGGVFGSLGAVGIGRATKSIISNPKASQEVDAKVGELESLQQDIQNPNVSPQAKEFLINEAGQKINEVTDIVENDIDSTDKLSQKDKVKLQGLKSESESLSSVVNDPNVSDVNKKSAQDRIEAIDKEISLLKPEEQTTFTYESMDDVPDSLKDRVVPTFKGEESVYELTMPKSEADALQQRIDEGKEPDMVRMEGETTLNEKDTSQEQTILPKTIDEIEANREKELDNVNTLKPIRIGDMTKKEHEMALKNSELKIQKEIDDINVKYDKQIAELNKRNESEQIQTNPTIENVETASVQEGATTEAVQETIENADIPREADNRGEATVPTETIQPTSDDNTGNGRVVEEVEKPKVETEFDKIAKKNIESKEVRQTLSNIEKVNDVNLGEEANYNAQLMVDAVSQGMDIVEAAKKEFGDNYVSGTLDYLRNSQIDSDKRTLITLSLGNDLRRQLQLDPNNLTLKKQIKLVDDYGVAIQRSAARAVGLGRIRDLVNKGFDAERLYEDFYSKDERANRNKIETAVHATSEDIQAEYERQQGDVIDDNVQQAIEEGVEKRLNDIYEALPSKRKQQADKAIQALERIQKKLRSKTYDATIGVPVAIIDSGISTIKAAIKAGVKVADAIELGIKHIKDKYGKEWKKEGAFRKDMLDGFASEDVDTNSGSTSFNRNSEVKQALIDAGYSRDINVRTKDGKEKRTIFDWKKLTGEEGSLDRINEVLDIVLPKKGYTDYEIQSAKEALKEEYNDIHADIIEKSINELERRNTPREGGQKILARRLAELYNLGLYDNDSNSEEYDRIINNALGLTVNDNAAFNQIKDLHKSLADLISFRDKNGNKLSDLALSTAESKIKNEIRKVTQKLAFQQGNAFYKTTRIAKDLINTMQRVLLNRMSQLVENPVSAEYDNLQKKVQDAFKAGKWDTPELLAQRRQMMKALYNDVNVNRGDEYGGVGSPFTTKNAFDDFYRGLGANKVWQAFVSATQGTAFLDSSDSAFKVKSTELEFTHNLIRVLTDKSNPNGAMSNADALRYVAENLTGQSFEDAKQTARDIIESVNEKAGKQLLSPAETNVLRLANDIVKDALVRGERISKDLVEDSFKAAYTTAGRGLGHESNNFLSKGLQALNRTIETDLNDAIKRKEFTRAGWLNLYSILSRNILNPFAGGGANWTVLGLQKMGVPIHWFDPSTYSNKTLDLSSIDGLRDAQRVLDRRASVYRSNGRTLVAGATGLTLAALAYGTGTDDEIENFRKNHKVADKYMQKVLPPALMLITSPKNSDNDRFNEIVALLGDRAGGYTDKKRIYDAIKEYMKKTRSGNAKANAKIGELVGNRVNFPLLSSGMAYDIRDIVREFEGKEPYKTDYKKKKGFGQGFFKKGWWSYLTEDDKK